MRLFETLALATAVNGHGRLMHPPGRSSLRFFPDDPSIAPFWSNINPNYNDNELYCGGLGVQIQNNYKCGICGDDFMKTRPRDNELSGRWGQVYRELVRYIKLDHTQDYALTLYNTWTRTTRIEIDEKWTLKSSLDQTWPEPFSVMVILVLSHVHTRPAVTCRLKSKSPLIIRGSSNSDSAKPMACWRTQRATSKKSHYCVWTMATRSSTSLIWSLLDLVKRGGGTLSMQSFKMIWSVTIVSSSGVTTRQTAGEVMSMVLVWDMGQVWSIN